MEIEIGEYVRTKTGYVGKVMTRKGGYGLWYELDINKEIQDNIQIGWVHEDKIANHSKDIIDLVEVEDYVKTEDEFGIIEIYYIDDNEMIQAIKEDLALNNFKLKTILTKEQYERDCYRLEE